MMNQKEAYLSILKNEKADILPISVSNFRLSYYIQIGNSFLFELWTYCAGADYTDFILYFDAKLPDSFYADFFVELFTAINGKQQVGDQAGEYLDH